MFCRALVTRPGAHTQPQDALAKRLGSSLQDLDDPDQRRRLIGFVYAQSGILQRHVQAPLDEVTPRADWIGVVNEASRSLAAATLADLEARDAEGVRGCQAFVVVTTSWVGFPSLSRVLQAQTDIPNEAVCYDLSGLGCAGPTHGIHLASTLLQQGYDDVVLLFVDTMATWGLLRRYDQIPSVGEIVAQCLASDGAGAMILGREPGPAPVFAAREGTLHTRLWPDSLDQNDLTACGAGQPYLSVGKDIRTRLVDEAGPVFDTDVVEHPLFLHPGGPDLMKRLRAAVPGIDAPIDVASWVLENHGNLGSASVLFVMEESMRRGMPLGPRFHMFALGPGIVTTLLRVDGVED